MRRSRLGWLVGPALLVPALGVLASRQPAALPLAAAQEPAEKTFAVSAHKYAFAPQTIDVRQDDLVKITLQTEDIPHSFTIDEYRISRRAEPGKPVTFDFHANRAGEFRIYCNLAIDDRCLRELTGVLIVEDR